MRKGVAACAAVGRDRVVDFFGKDSVLAGDMALRAYGSHRLASYDADLSTPRSHRSSPDQDEV